MSGPVEVTATQPGYYGSYRQTGDTFTVEKAEDVSEVWMSVRSESAVSSDADLAGDADDLDQMDKEALQAYAKQHFGVDLDRRKSEATMRAEIRELAAAD